MPVPTRLCAVLIAAAAIAAGCGSSDGPKEVAEAFLEANADGDGGSVCELLTDDVVEQVEEMTGEDCAAALEEQLTDEVRELIAETEIGDVEEDGDEATVSVEGPLGDDVIPLRRQDGEWRVASAMGSGSPDETGSDDDPGRPEPDGETTGEDPDDGANAPGEEEARETVESFLDSVANSDDQGVCDLLSRVVRRQVDATGDCAAAIAAATMPAEREQARESEIVGVEVDGTEATASVRTPAGDESFELVVESGEWKVLGDGGR